jgi:hypothetical protein
MTEGKKERGSVQTVKREKTPGSGRKATSLIGTKHRPVVFVVLGGLNENNATAGRAEYACLTLIPNRQPRSQESSQLLVGSLSD